MMQYLIESVRRSVGIHNWYAALMGALTLPDIAAKLDGRSGGSGARYIAWFDDYLLPGYTQQRPGEADRIFLSGNDCYALRCAFLHEGDFDITGQRVPMALERFKFVAPVPGCVVHCNRIGRVLQLQVDCFCEEICSAIEQWLAKRGADADVAAALTKLPKIDFPTKPADALL